MKKTNRSRVAWPRAAAVGTVVVALAPLAFGQDAPAPSAPAKTASAVEEASRTYVMPTEIVVSAADGGVPLHYPGGRDVIDRETLNRYPDANAATVLRRVPGVFILPENGNDGRIHVGIRGADPRRSGLTTVLIDGIPAAEAPYGNTDVDAMPITMERISRIDVIRGGASIRWGPNSAGGVVNFITEPVPEVETVRFGTRWGSDDDRSLWTSAGGTWDRFGALVTIVEKAGDGFRDNSDFTILDGSGKFRFALNDTDTISGSISRYTELDARQPGGLTGAAYADDPSQSLRKDADFRFDANTYSAQYVHEISSCSSLQFLAWYLEGYRGLFDFRPVVGPFTTRRVQESVFDHGAIEGRYTWATELGGMRHEFFHSARYLTETNKEFYYKNPIAGGPPITPYDLHADFDGHSWAFFTEDVISLTDTLKLAVGGRLEKIHMGSDSRDTTVSRTQNYSELLPEASLTWDVRPKTALYGSFQKNFATPQYETGFDPASLAYRPIDPEHSKTREVGARVREIEGLEFTAAYFVTDFTDKIDFLNLSSGAKVAVNTGEAESHGFEFGASYDLGNAMPDLKGLSVYATLTDMRSTIESGVNEGNDTPDAPHRLASWGVQWENDDGAWVRVGGSHTGSAFKDPENYETGSGNGIQGPLPSYTLWDASVGWNQNADGTGARLSLGVTNLFDEDYFRRFSTGIFPGAPRQFFVAANYTIRW